MKNFNDIIKQLEKEVPKEVRRDPETTRIKVFSELHRSEYGFNDDETFTQVKARLEKMYGKQIVLRVIEDIDVKAETLKVNFQAERLIDATKRMKDKRVNQR